MFISSSLNVCQNKGSGMTVVLAEAKGAPQGT
jgi:hypothetical protein